jgi:predicted aldo/keto reductase-like oxidoreductase
VSEIGLGCEQLQGKEYPVLKAIVDTAIDCGVTLFDVFMPEPTVRTYLGRALAGRRDQIVIQGHIGSTWKDGQYAVSRDMRENRKAFDDLLERLGTDYIDIGMLHFVDTEEDFFRVSVGELFEYVRELKKSGTIKVIGMSTHEASLAKRAAESGVIDVVMFSLNPAFDLLPTNVPMGELMADENAASSMQNQIDPNRAELYQSCEQHGTAITVMKAYMAGRLLSAGQSPFGSALTPAQCIHYALTRPAVASALIGCETPDEVRAAAAYETATDMEKDFSEVFRKTLAVEGKCVYCNHCLPCPSRIDIAQVNKYLDLATAVQKIPETVSAHYRALTVNAEDCVLCGDCEERCPFRVPVRQRMEDAVQIFGVKLNGD